MTFLEYNYILLSFCEAAEPLQLGFQDAATPMMQGIIDLHHDIFLIQILVFVLRIFLRALWYFHYQKNPIPQRIFHGTSIEILRTKIGPFLPFIIRRIADFIHPGLGIMLGILFIFDPRVSEAAGPSRPKDCWTGQPDEHLLRAMDRKLAKINEEVNTLASSAVDKAASFGLGLRGSAQEQRKDIAVVLDNYLFDIDIDKRLRLVRKWAKPQELDNTDSSFWLIILEEVPKLY